MPKQQSNTKERQHTRNSEPRNYNVIIHNDDFTPMDLVVIILKDVFFKPTPEAYAIMMKVHKSKSGVAGTYPYDIAVSKAQKATYIARNNGYPLAVTVEPAD